MAGAASGAAERAPVVLLEKSCSAAVAGLNVGGTADYTAVWALRTRSLPVELNVPQIARILVAVSRAVF